jgi:transposase
MHLPHRLWLCTTPTDMRKSYDGLIALISGYLCADPSAGEGFVFINRRRTQMKCLYFDTGGYCIWAKRLEQGLFKHVPRSDAQPLSLSQTEFAALLEGFDVAIVRRRKRYEKAEKSLQSG